MNQSNYKIFLLTVTLIEKCGWFLLVCQLENLQCMSNTGHGSTLAQLLTKRFNKSFSY